VDVDQVAVVLEAMVELLQPRPGGVIGVTVPPHDRPAPVAHLGQGLLKQSGQEANALLVAQASKALLDLLQWDGQEVKRGQIRPERVRELLARRGARKAL